jgi:hypothetical protein
MVLSLSLPTNTYLLQDDLPVHLTELYPLILQN